MKVSINQLSLLNKEEIQKIIDLLGYNMSYVAKKAIKTIDEVDGILVQAEDKLTEEEEAFLNVMNSNAKKVLDTIGYQPKPAKKMISIASIKRKLQEEK